MVTIFTPTYNRAHLLPNLYRSLQNQTCKDFEWLIVDDGSTDSTESVVNKWSKNELSFPIRYYKVQNGGKMRAINYGAILANGNYFCGIDSDDCFYKDAISSIINAFDTIKNEKKIVGVSFCKAHKDGLPLNTNINNFIYIDCKNYDRKNYGLETDMIQIFYTDLMLKYKIPVWNDEKFTPECVFIDQIALDGYYMRYYSKTIYYGEYLHDGLSENSWKLLRDNPMGYAMMYNVQMQYHKGYKQKTNDIVQFVSCCCLKKEYTYVLKCHFRILAILYFIPGFLLSLRRKTQFEKIIKQ